MRELGTSSAIRDPAPVFGDLAPKLADLIENVEFCSTLSLLVISHHGSYKYAFKACGCCHFNHATLCVLCVSVVFAVAQCLSVRHIRVLYSDG